jgi:DNA-binding MarR family transcriptional regulator
MSSVTPGAYAKRRRLTLQIKTALRELSTQLSVLNHQVSAKVDLRDVDFDCVDIVNRHGPMSPSALARIAGLHPATMTGILDRLERGGWVVRERDAADRRSVIVRALRERNAEVYRLFAPMNASMNEICAGYDESQLEMLADFLRRTTDAGRDAAERFTSDPAP